MTEAWAALDVATEAAAGRAPKGRRATSAEDVARVYAAARERGQAPRAAVCQALTISTRTADRYISEARRRGLVAPYTTEEGQRA